MDKENTMVAPPNHLPPAHATSPLRPSSLANVPSLRSQSKPRAKAQVQSIRFTERIDGGLYLVHVPKDGNKVLFHRHDTLEVTTRAMDSFMLKKRQVLFDGDVPMHSFTRLVVQLFHSTTQGVQNCASTPMKRPKRLPPSISALTAGTHLPDPTMNPSPTSSTPDQQLAHFKSHFEKERHRNQLLTEAMSESKSRCFKYQQQAAELQVQLTQLAEKHDAATLRVAEAEKLVNEKDDQLLNMGGGQEENDRLQSELSSALHRIMELTGVVEQKQREIDTLGTVTDNSDLVQQLRDQLQANEAEYQRKYHTSGARILDLVDQLKVKTKECEEKENDIQLCFSNLEDSYKGRAADANAHKAAMQAKEEEIMQLNARLDVLQDNRNQSEAQLAKQKMEHIELKQDSAEAKREVDALKSTLDEKTTANHHLQKKLDEVSASLAEYRTYSAQVKASFRELKTTSSSELAKQQTRAKELSSNLAETKEAYDSLKQEVDRKTKQFDDMKAGEQAQKQTIRELQEKLSLMDVEIAKKTKEMDELYSMSKAIGDEKIKLAQEHANLVAEFNATKDAMTKAKESELGTLKVKLFDLTQKSTDLESEKTELTGYVETLLNERDTLEGVLCDVCKGKVAALSG